MAKYRNDNRVALENDATRLDIVEKVNGKALYTTDYYLPKMLWAAYIRAPHGVTKIKSSKLDAAQAVKGVLEVEITKQEGRYHGDRLGHVCAESRRALRDAFSKLVIDYEVLPPRTDVDALRTPMEKLKPDEKNDAAAQKALDESDFVEEATFSTQVQTHCCLEPHAMLVDFRGETALAYGSTQGTFSVRDDLAKMLKLRPDQVEFHCEYVGGGFGSKFGAGPEGQLAATMSQKYNRPCRVVNDRKEEQLDTGNRPGSIQTMRIGLGKDGKMRGGKVYTWGSVGAGAAAAGGGGGAGGGVRNPSRYNFGTVAKVHEDVNLSGGFPKAMRSPGHPQAMFAIELMMDHLAAKVGMDPLAFRLLNETSDTRREMLKVGAELIGWSNRKPDGTTPGPIKRGFGIGAADWGNGRGKATINVNVYRAGTVEVVSGCQDVGMGFRTMIGDVVRTHIGVPRDLLVVKVGRSDYPPGPGSGGSVTSRTTAPKAFAAAELAKKGVIKLVAKEWGIADDATLKMDAGAITDGTRTIKWTDACRLMTDDRMTFSASEDGEYWKPPTNSEAIQFCEAEVDVETGIVRVKKIVALQEVGLPVNRHTIENQITGGIIQNVSYCLFEDRILDRRTGAMVNANMEMYKIAGPKDVPEIVPIIWRSRPDSGVNSLGESPGVPTLGAIGCAVANAIGVQVRTMPLSPRNVLAALDAKSGKGGAA